MSGSFEAEQAYNYSIFDRTQNKWTIVEIENLDKMILMKLKVEFEDKNLRLIDHTHRVL